MEPSNANEFMIVHCLAPFPAITIIIIINDININGKNQKNRKHQNFWGWSGMLWGVFGGHP